MKEEQIIYMLHVKDRTLFFLGPKGRKLDKAWKMLGTPDGTTMEENIELLTEILEDMGFKRLRYPVIRMRLA